MSLLETLVEEDFGLRGHGRYKRSLIHDSLVVDTERDLFFWNSRGVYGDVVDYLTKVRGWSKRKSEKFVRTLHKKYIDKGLKLGIVSDERPSLEFIDAFYENLKRHGKFEYFEKRGLNRSTIDRYKLGYFSRGGIDFYTVPIYEELEPVNVQVRTERIKSLGRKIVYKMYKLGRVCVQNSHFLKILKTVYLVEGLIDCLLLTQFGYPTVSTDSGLAWRDEFFKLFGNVRTLYIIQDNDQAGMSGAMEWMRKLGVETVRVFDWSQLPEAEEKEDVVSYFQKFGDVSPLVNEKNYFGGRQHVQ